MKKILFVIYIIVLIGGTTACRTYDKSGIYKDRTDDEGLSAKAGVIDQLEIVDSGYTLSQKKGRYFVGYAMKVKNPNGLFTADHARYKTIVRNKEGKVIETSTSVLPCAIPEKTTMGYAECGLEIQWDQDNVKQREKPAKVEFEIINTKCFYYIAPLRDYPNMKKVFLQNVAFKRDKRGGTISGELIDKNRSSINGRGGEIVCVLYKDKNNQLVGGDYYSLEREDIVEEKSNYLKVRFKISTNWEFVSDNYELYVIPDYALGPW